MRKIFISTLFVFLAVSLFAQTEARFQKTDHRVYDYSGILTAEQSCTLDSRLISFEDSTSNQIAVIFTPTLYGEEIKDLGTRIGQAWGVGQKELDNGVIILIKTKTPEEPDGDVAILPGEGLEGALPDVFCARIIDDTMLNELIAGNYYQAVVNALNVIEPGDGAVSAIIMLLIWGVIIWYIVRRIRKAVHYDGGSGGYGGGYSGGSYSSGRSSSHSGGFHSSRSSSGRSFGGGSFGGGGASRKF